VQKQESKQRIRFLTTLVMHYESRQENTFTLLIWTKLYAMWF